MLLQGRPDPAEGRPDLPLHQFGIESRSMLFPTKLEHNPNIGAVFDSRFLLFFAELGSFGPR